MRNGMRADLVTGRQPFANLRFVHDCFPGSIPIICFANPPAHQELNSFAAKRLQNTHALLETACVTIVKTDYDFPAGMRVSKFGKFETLLGQLRQLPGKETPRNK